MYYFLLPSIFNGVAKSFNLKVLAPAAKRCTLGEFAINEGFKLSHQEGVPQILTAGFRICYLGDVHVSGTNFPLSSWMHNLCSDFTQHLIGT